MNDNINRPKHYKQNGIECIDVIAAAIGQSGSADFCMGNAIKYLFRHNHKDSNIEDVKKAIWYLNKWLDYMEADEKPVVIGCPFDEPLTGNENIMLLNTANTNNHENN